jgi:hypothetical protein
LAPAIANTSHFAEQLSVFLQKLISVRDMGGGRVAEIVQGWGQNR